MWGYIFNLFILFFAVYSLASLAGLISERSGIVNIAIDGTMILGALTWAILVQSGNAFAVDGVFGTFGPFFALLIAGAVGMAYSYFLSFASIKFMADQTIVGTAMNMMAVAISFLVMQPVVGKGAVDIDFKSMSQGWLGSEINTYAFWFLMIAMFICFVAWFILNKTKYGLRLRTAGENPYSLETAGISVAKTRYTAVSISGFLAGMAGAIFAGTLAQFSGTVTGAGYIAIAILILGQWRVGGIIAGSALMSIAFAIFNGYDFINISSELMKVIPFMFPIIILVFIKLSSEEKLVKRQHKFLHDKKLMMKGNAKKTAIWIVPYIFVFIFFWSWFIWIYGAYYIAGKDEELMNRIYTKDSVFKLANTSGPAANGKPYKKDLRE